MTKVVVDVTAIGRKGGQATAASRTPAEREEAARMAVQARWDAYYAAHPEKLKAKKEREARKRQKKKAQK
jgi:hypothetical protein